MYCSYIVEILFLGLSWRWMMSAALGGPLKYFPSESYDTAHTQTNPSWDYVNIYRAIVSDWLAGQIGYDPPWHTANQTMLGRVFSSFFTKPQSVAVLGCPFILLWCNLKKAISFLVLARCPRSILAWISDTHLNRLKRLPFGTSPGTVKSYRIF